MKVSGLTPLKRSEGGPCGSLRIFICAMWVKVVLKVFVFPDLVVKKKTIFPVAGIFLKCV